MRVQGGKGRRNSRPGELALLVALGFILAGCSSSGPQSSDHHSAGYHRGQPSYKVGSPYQINGKWYTPQVDYGYDETGLASWYGAAFDGQATANGEIFNLNELSAAHKQLPLPQGAMVAAPPPQELAAPRAHWPSLITPAHAETLPPAAAAHPRAMAMTGSTSGRIFIQAGAFAMPENAQRVRARIAALGNVQVVPAQVNGSALYRVRVGPFANEAEADQLLSKVFDSGYPTARIVSE